MDKVHYCERFIELMIDLEVRHIICHFYALDWIAVLEIYSVR